MEPRWETPVRYRLSLGEESVELNTLLGDEIQIRFEGEKACRHCGRRIRKTYNQGYCYPCFRDLAENDLCIVKPHQCHFHEGTCRDESFGNAHCMQPHLVYLALSSGVKVGITRKTNAYNRWMNQGAVKAVPIAEVPTRKESGELELHLSQYLSDRTDWRRMLKNEIEERDLLQVREEILPHIPERFHPFLLEGEEVCRFRYPLLSTPEKIKTINLDKQEEVRGRLLGIKAQYLILDIGVFNVRKFTGYRVQIARMAG
ncbi:DUF2797 domain-containing protein [Desmospora profundinema]|nr:DUF2797 domain-containing protein [Desmospora profundinema]